MYEEIATAREVFGRTRKIQRGGWVLTSRLANRRMSTFIYIFLCKLFLCIPAIVRHTSWSCANTRFYWCSRSGLFADRPCSIDVFESENCCIIFGLKND